MVSSWPVLISSAAARTIASCVRRFWLIRPVSFRNAIARLRPADRPEMRLRS
jgi:hypothetical protein